MVALLSFYTLSSSQCDSRCSVSSLLSLYTLTSSQCDSRCSVSSFRTFLAHLQNTCFSSCTFSIYYVCMPTYYELCSRTYIWSQCTMFFDSPRTCALYHAFENPNYQWQINDHQYKGNSPFTIRSPHIPPHQLLSPNTHILSSSSLISIAFIYLPLAADTWYQYRFNSPLWFWIIAVPLRQPFN